MQASRQSIDGGLEGEGTRDPGVSTEERAGFEIWRDETFGVESVDSEYLQFFEPEMQLFSPDEVKDFYLSFNNKEV